MEKYIKVNSSIKKSNISYFSFTIRLNERKKVPLKNWFGERRGYMKSFAGGLNQKRLEKTCGAGRGGL